MGSNEALEKPADMAESDLGPLDGTIGDGIAGAMAGPEYGTAAQGSGVGPAGDGFVPTNDLTRGGSSLDRKRKRTHAVDEGEAALITNMTESVREVAAAIRATAYTEV
ncbi:uncharacterized protein LOC121055698 [Oryza brachyantha]|uniref:uncharacterized protein LOC121055698 n=1 Tax=Oryza brachyantha TaxID=4533 RepID=UPI001ADC1360|nr:uncharacterized protein LOC121055698 [Oryza brachyantha]